MGFVKGLIVAVLSLLLFVSLVVSGVFFTVNSTLLNEDFVARQVERVDISQVTEEIARPLISGQLPPEMAFLEDTIYEAVDKLEPQLAAAVTAAVCDAYAWLKGETDTLRISISLAPLLSSLEDDLYQEFQNRLPAPLSLLPPAQQRAVFDTYFQEFARELPQSVEFTEADIPPEYSDEIVAARTVISWSQRVFYLLITFMVLLAALVAVTERDVRKTSRAVGITTLIYGAIVYIGILTTKNAPLSGISAVPAEYHPLLSAVFNDAVRPLEMLSLGVLVAGVVLMIVSFVYKSRHAED